MCLFVDKLTCVCDSRVGRIVWMFQLTSFVKVMGNILFEMYGVMIICSSSFTNYTVKLGADSCDCFVQIKPPSSGFKMRNNIIKRKHGLSPAMDNSGAQFGAKTWSFLRPVVIILLFRHYISTQCDKMYRQLILVNNRAEKCW